MNTRTALLAASLAALVAVAGCSSTIEGSARAATTIPVAMSTTESNATPESTDAPGTDATSLEPSAGEPAPPSTPQVTETDSGDFSPMSSSLDPASVTWISAFCTSFTDVMAYAEPDVSGLSGSESVQKIADAYAGMSDAAVAAATYLDGMATPSFPGADSMAPAIHDWLLSVATVYADGAQDLASEDIGSASELTAEIQRIEAGMTEPNERLGLAIGDIDASVADTISALPECAPLAGGG